jgi:large subunit ribosomal protein L22
MEEHVVRAKALYIRMAPRKVRVVANAIRGKRVDVANAVLSFIPRRAVRPVTKVLNTAIYAAKQAGNFDLDNLFVKEIFVDQGPALKRGLARARGMVTKIHKFTSHVTVVLGELE